MFKTKFVEKTKTHVIINNFFFQKSYNFLVNVEEYCRTRQATDDDIARLHCILDN